LLNKTVPSFRLATTKMLALDCRLHLSSYSNSEKGFTSTRDGMAEGVGAHRSASATSSVAGEDLGSHSKNIVFGRKRGRIASTSLLRCQLLRGPWYWFSGMAFS
jgi:hypothetical protein